MDDEDMEYRCDSDHERLEDDLDADDDSEEELKRIEAELYSLIHFDNIGDSVTETAEGVSADSDASVQLRHLQPPSASCSSAQADTLEREPLSRLHKAAPCIPQKASTCEERSGSVRRAKPLNYVAVTDKKFGDDPPKCSVLSGNQRDCCISNQSLHLKNSEQSTQSGQILACSESSKTASDCTLNLVNTAVPAMCIGTLLQVIERAKEGGVSDDSDSSWGSDLETKRLPSEIPTSASGSVSDRLCAVDRNDISAVQLGDSVEDPANSIPSKKEQKSVHRDHVSVATLDHDKAYVLPLKDKGRGERKGKLERKKKYIPEDTQCKSENLSSKKQTRGKLKEKDTCPQTSKVLASDAGTKKPRKKKDNAVTVTVSSSLSSGEESDSESSSTEDSSSRAKKLTKKRTKHAAVPKKTLQKSSSGQKGKKKLTGKVSHLTETDDREVIAISNSSDSQSVSDSGSEKPKTAAKVSKVLKNVIYCLSDSDSNTGKLKKPQQKKLRKDVKSAFSTCAKSDVPDKRSGKSVQKDVIITVSSDFSSEESDAESSSKSSASDSKSLDVNDSDFLNQLSDSSLKADILYNLNQEDQNKVRQSLDSEQARTPADESKWQVNARDMAASSGIRNSGSRGLRYFCQASFRCHNCQTVGHLARDCPKPKKVTCHLCGVEGHGGSACPMRPCYNCSQPGHDARECSEPRRSRYMICHRCQMGGHKQEECPDRWRQFHATTSGSVPVKAKETKNRVISCYNCGTLGHLGFECTQSRMNHHDLPSYPFVAYYDSRSAIALSERKLQREAENQRDQKTAGASTALKKKDDDAPVKLSRKKKAGKNTSPLSTTGDDMRTETAERVKGRRKRRAGKKGDDLDEKSDSQQEKTSKKRKKDKTDGLALKRTKLSGPLEEFISLGEKSDSQQETSSKKRKKDKTEDLALKRTKLSGPLGEFISLDEKSDSQQEKTSKKRKKDKTDGLALKRTQLSGPLEEFISLGDKVKANSRPVKQRDARPASGKGDVTGDVTTHHLLPDKHQVMIGIMGGQTQQPTEPPPPPPPPPTTTLGKRSRKKKREEGERDYGHHSTMWGEAGDPLHLLGASVSELVNNYNNDNDNDPWDGERSGSKRGKYDYPRAPHDGEGARERTQAPRLSRKAQLRAEKQAFRKQRNLRKQRRKMRQQREAEDGTEPQVEGDHQVFHNEWWHQPSTSTTGKSKNRRRKKKRNNQGAFEDDEDGGAGLTGITPRQRKRRKNNPQAHNNSLTKNDHFRRDPNSSGKGSPHGLQKKPFRGGNSHQNQKNFQGKKNPQQFQGSVKQSDGYLHFNKRKKKRQQKVNVNANLPDFSRGKRQSPGHFVSERGFVARKDILDRASKMLERKRKQSKQ